VISVIFTYRWGISSMIIGYVIASLLSYCLNCYYTGKMLHYSFFEQMNDLLPIAFLSGIMGVLVYIIRFTPVSSYHAILIIQVLTGILLYISFAHFFKLSAFHDIADIVKPQLRKYFRAS
jgi:hypothetical protein